MKKKKISAILLIILTIIVIYFLMKDDYSEIVDSLIHMNILWLILGIFLYMIYTILQAIPFFYITKLYDKNINFSFFIYLVVVTNFFNGITPLATGGQPLQIYELYKKKISTVNSSNIVIQNSIIFQTSVVLWFIIAVILNSILHLIHVNSILKHLAIIGFILNFILLLGFIIISFSKTFNKKLINVIIKIFSKLHIIKDEKNTKNKWDKTCNDFYNNSKVLLINKKIVLKSIIILLIAFTCYYAIPICIVYATHTASNLTLVTTIVISSFVFLSSSYLPIPGATGGMEYAFMNYFGEFIIGYKLNTILLIWRFITYYLPTVIGGITFNIKSMNDK